MQEVTVTRRHFRTKEEALREIVDAGWWPLSWRDPPGETYAPHKHGADQTVYLVEGAMRLEIAGRVYDLEPGDRLDLPALTVHSAKTPEGAVYIIGMPEVDLIAEHALPPDA